MDDYAMTEPGGATEMPDSVAPDGAADSASRLSVSNVPETFPDKFRDPENGSLRADLLLQSYGELERRQGGIGIPEGPDGYRIEPKHSQLPVDPAVNAKLHAAGFSQEQAQLVYDMAVDHLRPALTQAASVFERQRQVERLNHHFGGADKWGEVSQQVMAWGKSNLPPDVYVALSSSYDGVLALHRMMSDGGAEPGLGRAQGGADGLSETKLRKMMEDPRYWRDQDPAYADEIRRGFERLYPSEG